MSAISGRSRNREQKAWDRLEQLEEDSGLGVSEAFDEVEVDSSLPENVPAATQFDDYELMVGELIDEEPEALLKLNDTFFYLGPDKKDEVLFHESMHGLEGKDRLIPQLKYRKGISKDFEKDLTTAFSYGGIDQTEGIVQALAAELNDSTISDYFRRYETRGTHERWREKGLEPGKELSDEIEGFRREMLDEFGDREVYNVEIGEGLYLECGEFMGEEYAVAVSCEDAEVYGQEVADQYLEDLYDADLDYEGLEDEKELYLEGYEDEYEFDDGSFDEEFVPDILPEEQGFEEGYEFEDGTFEDELVPEPL